MNAKKSFIISLVLIAGLMMELLIVSSTLAQTKVLLKPGGKATSLNSSHSITHSTLNNEGTRDTLNNNKIVKRYDTVLGADGEDILAAWFVCPDDLKIKACGIDAGDNPLGARAEIKIVKINKEWTEEKLKNAGSENLGYWISGSNTNKIYPFSRDVKDNRNWISNTTAALNPFGDDLWSDNGIGAPIVPQKDGNIKTYQWIEMNVLNNEPSLKKGDIFAVCIKNVELKETNNSFGLMATSESGYGVFKYYANGRTKGDLTTAGWWKREYLLNVAVAVEITGDSPPTISDVDILSSILSNGTKAITAKITDQNPSGGIVGVGNTYLQYFLNKDTTWKEITMTKSSGDIYTGTLPGQQPATKVTYRIKAIDVNGNIAISNEWYSYFVFAPTPGVNSLLVFNGMDPEGLTKYPLANYFEMKDVGKVYSWPHDTWAYGPLTTELVNKYTNIFEISSSENAGESIKYNDEVIRTWLQQNGNRNYALAGQEWLGARNGFIDRDFIAGTFEYDVLGITHSYNDVADLGSSTKPTRMFAKQSSLLGDELYKKFTAWGTDSLQYDLYYELNKTENWIDGFEVITGQSVDMEVEARFINGTAIKQNVASLTHRILSAGNKIVFFSFDPIAVNTKPPSTNNKYFRFGSCVSSPQMKVLNWFNVLTDVKGDGISLPTQFKLFQNYPNPFNPTTTIKYSIPSVETRHASSLHVSLKVFDILGREVVTLVNEEKQPGNYKVKFDGSNLASGVYLYRLSTSEYTSVKKLILMK